MPQEGVVLSQREATPASRVVPPKFGFPRGEPPRGAERPRWTGDARGSASAAQHDPVCWQSPATPKDDLEQTELGMIAEGASRRPEPKIKTAVKEEPVGKQ